MKLHSKKRKLLTIIPLSILAILLLALIIVLVVSAIRSIPSIGGSGGDTDTVMLSISSRPNKTVYYVGEEFDPRGTKAQVIKKDFDNSYFVDYTELTFEGFDSSKPNDKLAITVRYGNVSTQMYITIKEEGQVDKVYLSDIEVVNLKMTYSLSDWNTYGVVADGATIKRTYSDGTVNDENAPLKYSYIQGYTKMDSAGTTEITIRYKEDGYIVEKTITITITD